MRGTISLLDTGSRALSYFLGIVVLALAGAVYATSLDAVDIAEWTRRMFGTTFLVLLSALVFAALFAWARMGRAVDAPARGLCLRPACTRPVESRHWRSLTRCWASASASASLPSASSVRKP